LHQQQDQGSTAGSNLVAGSNLLQQQDRIYYSSSRIEFTTAAAGSNLPQQQQDRIYYSSSRIKSEDQYY
jgi:hypothetical protein